MKFHLPRIAALAALAVASVFAGAQSFDVTSTQDDTKQETVFIIHQSVRSRSTTMMVAPSRSAVKERLAVLKSQGIKPLGDPMITPNGTIWMLNDGTAIVLQTPKGLNQIGRQVSGGTRFTVSDPLKSAKVEEQRLKKAGFSPKLVIDKVPNGPVMAVFVICPKAYGANWIYLYGPLDVEVETGPASGMRLFSPKSRQ